MFGACHVMLVLLPLSLRSEKVALNRTNEKDK